MNYDELIQRKEYLQQQMQHYQLPAGFQLYHDLWIVLKRKEIYYELIDLHKQLHQLYLIKIEQEHKEHPKRYITLMKNRE